MAHCVFPTTWPRWRPGSMIKAWIPRSCSRLSFHDTTASTTTSVYRPYLSCSSVAVYIRSPRHNKPDCLKGKLTLKLTVETNEKTLWDGSKAFHLHVSLLTMITSLITPWITNEKTKTYAGAMSLEHELLNFFCKHMRNCHSITFISVSMDNSWNAHVNLDRVQISRQKLC